MSVVSDNVTRRSRPELEPLVERVWASGGPAREPVLEVSRERMLPTGAMHLVVRVGAPLRIYRSALDRDGETFGRAVVGGVRVAPYLRDLSSPVIAVGAMLRPGAAQALFGVPADALAHRHTSLDDLWGTEAHFVSERLEGALDAETRLGLFEDLLVERLRRATRRPHAAVAHATARFTAGAQVLPVVEECGYSHRRFVTLFTEEVGLTPKVFCRLQRFQRVLPLLARAEGDLSRIALEVGYADQAHMTREFKDLTGISPGEFRRRRPTDPHHVPEREA